MKLKLTLLSLCSSLVLHASPDQFSQDRAAILGMAGAFEIEFNFEETISLSPGYELKKPYQAKASELVKVVEDTGKRIVLQHLLIVDDMGDPEVIKHWGQIWQYEDPRSLTFEGNNTWLPQNHSAEETKGSWTQFVTQIDDSPRYKAQGRWTHHGNLSTWTSAPSTRPLPRRDYTKRSDYDLLVVTNHHSITPDGWVHQQDNKKLVTRNGQHHFLCAEAGLNHYRRITDEKKLALFVPAEAYWKKTHHFWKDVRVAWAEIIETSEQPIRYERQIEGKRLMSRMRNLADEATAETKIASRKIQDLLAQYLR